MAFKVFEVAKEKKKDVYLKLVEECGRITLIACDEDGDPMPNGNIFRIVDGQLLLYRHVNEALGFKLDEDGSVKVE